MKIFIFLVLLLLLILVITCINNEIKQYKEPIELNFKKWVLPNSVYPNWYKVVKNGYSIKMTNTGITLPAKNFSIIMMYKLTALNESWNNILHITNTGNDCCSDGDRIPGIWVRGNDTRYHFNFSTNDGVQGFDSIEGIALNIPSLLSLIFDNDTVSLYINNRLIVSQRFNNIRMIQPNATLYIGNPWHNNRGEIEVQDFTIYDGALSLSQINTIYNESTPEGRQKIINDAKNAADIKATNEAKIISDTATAYATDYAKKAQETRTDQKKTQANEQLIYFINKLRIDVNNNDIAAIENDKIRIQQYQNIIDSPNP
jgi:hypothetical protein